MRVLQITNYILVPKIRKLGSNIFLQQLVQAISETLQYNPLQMRLVCVLRNNYRTVRARRLFAGGFIAVRKPLGKVKIRSPIIML